jgi:hypothetical protein
MLVVRITRFSQPGLFRLKLSMFLVFQISFLNSVDVAVLVWEDIPIFLY